MNEKKLSVRLYGKPVGMLEQLLSGEMAFSYSEIAKAAVSVGMPIREQAYPHIHCEAFFGGFLPESETAKYLIGKQYGVNHNNSFSLLKAIGYDCAGAISFHLEDEPVASQDHVELEGKVVSDESLYEHIKALPQKPLFLGFEGLRLSLAGAQDKAAVCIIDGKIALPKHGCPTTHILKPAIAGLKSVIENEYFCLRIAKRMGLTVPNVEIRQLKDISFLLVERYDRYIADNKVTRIHQEDFCQALGITSAHKYQADGGPGFKQAFELLDCTAQPVISRQMLAEGLVFNYLIGNMDAHGKNFSLLHSDNANISLAPFYDMLCTLVYPDLATKMAMKIGNQYVSKDVSARYWEQLCKDINFSYPSLKKIIDKQSRLVLKFAAEEKQNLIEMGRDVSMIEKVIKIIEGQIEQMI